MAKVVNYKDGTKRYFDAEWRNHRTDGPAIEYGNGRKEWMEVIARPDRKFARIASCGMITEWIDTSTHTRIEMPNGFKIKWDDGVDYVPR